VLKGVALEIAYGETSTHFGTKRDLGTIRISGHDCASAFLVDSPGREASQVLAANDHCLIWLLLERVKYIRMVGNYGVPPPIASGYTFVDEELLFGRVTELDFGNRPSLLVFVEALLILGPQEKPERMRFDRFRQRN